MQSVWGVLDMTVATKHVPVIDGWPYVEIAEAHTGFVKLFNRQPSTLFVGIDLWMSLRRVSKSDEFWTMEIPIILDRAGILEGSEFLFSL